MSVLLEAMSVTADTPLNETFPLLQLENYYGMTWRRSGLGYWIPHPQGYVNLISGSFDPVEGEVPATALIEHDAVANKVTWTLDGVELLACEVGASGGFQSATASGLTAGSRWRGAWVRTTGGDERTWDWHNVRDLLDWAPGYNLVWWPTYVEGVLEAYVVGYDAGFVTLQLDRLSLHGGQLLNAVIGRPLWLHRSGPATLVEETLS